MPPIVIARHFEASVLEDNLHYLEGGCPQGHSGVITDHLAIRRTAASPLRQGARASWPAFLAAQALDVEDQLDFRGLLH
jgi:hypothetical protein